MLKQFLKISLPFALLAGLFLTSCQKDGLTTQDELVDNFVDETLFRLQGEGNLGRFGCYELVFPVTLQLPDSTTVTGESYEELKAAVQAWKEANPDVQGRPAFVFPIELLTEDGEVLSVADKEELRTLKEECGGDYFDHHGHHGHGGNCTPCFEIVFPLTIQFPDGTTAEITDRQEMKMTIREWKQANPDATERPELVFPIEVEMEDGTVVTVNSKEELKALKDSCD